MEVFSEQSQSNKLWADLFYSTIIIQHLRTKRGLATAMHEKRSSLPVPSTIWKALISARSLRMNWTSSKEIPE